MTSMPLNPGTPFRPHLTWFLTWPRFLTHTLSLAAKGTTVCISLTTSSQPLAVSSFSDQTLNVVILRDRSQALYISPSSHHPWKFTYAHLLQQLQWPFMGWWLPRSSSPYCSPDCQLYNSNCLLNISVWMSCWHVSLIESFPQSQTVLCYTVKATTIHPVAQARSLGILHDFFLAFYPACKELPTPVNTICFSFPTTATSV